MPVEDKEVSRRIIREIYKMPIDPSLVTVTCIGGTVYIGGRIRRSRTPATRGMNMTKIVEDIKEYILKFPKVNDVIIDAQIDDIG
jgi:hypothetical protein